MNSTASSIETSDILIVDDTINNLRLLSSILSQSGFSVRKAINGRMALNAIHACKPDLVLLDISMPDMDGYEVCQHLKQDPQTQEIPVIFLSASDMPGDKVKAFGLGGTDYITKPFHSEEVVARIQNQLLLSQLRSELKTKNHDLEKALSQLKTAQVELVQKEKMLGLSQLIAGIAHEINNPISFIAGNLGPARQYFLDLVNIINLYRQRYPDPGEEIDTAIQSKELDFITHDFSNVMKSMERGTKRICEIVQALQTFSHHGESTIKTVNLHTTLGSILTLLKPRLRGQGSRPSIYVCYNYDNLPLVTCDAKLISQAILHLLDNAIDAIDTLWENRQKTRDITNDSRQEPEIVISTEVPQADLISISIRDNGIGISDEIKSRIYDPFFTTKSIGSGKGLGLSISYQIIVGKHKGHLFFKSHPFQGSEFTLQIPTEMEPVSPKNHNRVKQPFRPAGREKICK
ncbi:MAG: hybrid sensor histidine kinase/response regulator [Leptolyngbya sp. SIO1D8]|nr:hybrid sensor histidine kinase/response regulator [Leptolyngbya sp. SIO1D8]